MKRFWVALVTALAVASAIPLADAGARSSAAAPRSTAAKAKAKAKKQRSRTQSASRHRDSPGRKAVLRHRALNHALARRPQRQGADAKPRGLKPKNRGDLATLKGLRKGKKLTLVDPTTGHVDRNAKISDMGIDPWSKTPFVWIRFSNFNEMRFAAERVQLIGKKLGVQKRYIKTKRSSLFKAMEKYLGVKVQGRAKVVPLRGRNYGPRKRSRVNGPRLGPFLRALDEHLEPDEGLVGFERDKTAFISRHYGAWDSTTTAHELIHAITEPFIDQADKKGLIGMMEGLTDHFTYKVSTPHFGAEPNPNHPYYDFQRFAEHIEKTVGGPKVKKLFFSGKKDSLKKMAEAYDKQVGKRGIFYKRARALEDGTLVFDKSGEPSISKPGN